MNNNKTYQLVLTGLFAAIIVLMTVTPLGYIPMGIINATIIHIPVILGALFCGPKKGAFLGFMFGLTSCIKNTLMPNPSSFVFSPVLAMEMAGFVGVLKSLLICFVPRILVGVLPYFVYLLVKKILGTEKKALWGTILNILIGLFLCIGVRAFFGRRLENYELATIIGVVTAVIVTALLIFVSLKKNVKPLAFSYAGVVGSMTNTLLVMGGIYFLYKDSYAVAIGKEVQAILGVVTGVISFNGVVEAVVAAILVSAVGIALNKIAPITQKEA